MNEGQEKLASSLLRIGAIKFGEFRLKLHEQHPDAPLSPVYVDLRVIRSFPDVLDLAVSAYEELAAGLEYDLVADVPTAATPIVAVLSHATRVPMVSPRLGGKSHGTATDVDGAYTRRQRVLLVDDLITTAGSKIEAIATLEQHDLIVAGVVVLVDREQGGKEQLAHLGYDCRSAFTLRGLLDYYVQRQNINRDDYDRTLAYLGLD
jgi:orotate phosphoribosyltransferase